MDNNYDQRQSMNLEEPVSVGEWLVALLVMLIPCVNIVMMFVWAFGSSKKSKSNYFKAALIMMVIVIVLSFIVSAIFGAALFSALNGLAPY